MATDCGLITDLISGTGRNVSLLQSIQNGSGANPSLLCNGYYRLFPHLEGGGGGTRVAQTPSPSAGVKNGRAILPLPHMSSWHDA
jgi:hypothetical protein